MQWRQTRRREQNANFAFGFGSICLNPQGLNWITQVSVHLYLGRIHGRAGARCKFRFLGIHSACLSCVGADFTTDRQPHPREFQIQRAVTYQDTKAGGKRAASRAATSACRPLPSVGCRLTIQKKPARRHVPQSSLKCTSGEMYLNNNVLTPSDQINRQCACLLMDIP